MCGQLLALKIWIDFLKSLGFSDEVIAVIIEAYNEGVVKPTDAYPIITQGPVLSTKSWSLVPAWATAPQKAATFNARIETAAERPTFKDAFARRHALVPVAGFHEWSGPAASRQKWTITRKDNEPLVLAGLWEGDTFTVLTRAAGTQMATIHDREPVVVGRRQWQAWLHNDLFDPALPPEDFYRFEPVGDVQTSLF
ncbi:SOS response-associated peptidase [Asticcacaulis sp. YBE204]|uniref:SOS response-associated peptidase n=1 Tax=Asticcacaulis sp. YBE204 TaxID=1282363 RepID=UPI0003C3D262|nr:SOS response-associated peptidase family protein [Asticcacaulis sp. YBE204]ESQ77958.1 hypothetical protein AEYBE204_15800 [Asticcacaulis sp. YBE204]